MTDKLTPKKVLEKWQMEISDCRDSRGIKDRQIEDELPDDLATALEETLAWCRGAMDMHPDLEAVEFVVYRQFICPKCFTEFEDPDPLNLFPHGLLCPECKRHSSLVGVIHPQQIMRKK